MAREKESGRGGGLEPEELRAGPRKDGCGCWQKQSTARSRRDLSPARAGRPVGAPRGRAAATSPKIRGVSEAPPRASPGARPAPKPSLRGLGGVAPEKGRPSSPGAQPPLPRAPSPGATPAGRVAPMKNVPTREAEQGRLQARRPSAPRPPLPGSRAQGRPPVRGRRLEAESPRTRRVSADSESLRGLGESPRRVAPSPSP